ncbi:MAG TPA: hypothetical protein VJ785_14805, partial [Anaerolineales bacterium]|nr:hypothetical protein [Anaerolineales bacterium]
LPDWLKEVHRQSRDSAEEDVAQAASMPKVQKEEPPDLLAGLAFQAAKADDDDVPDWLAGLSPKADEKPASPAAPSQPDSDLFAGSSESLFGGESKPEPPESLSSMGGSVEQSPASPEHDELSEWFARASEQPAEPFSLEADSCWSPSSDASPAPSQEEEDLSWLRNLEAESKKTDKPSTPKQDDDSSFVFGTQAQAGSTPASSQDDLSWLDNLGGLPDTIVPAQQPSQPSQAASAPPAPQDDLNWLDELAVASQVSQSVDPGKDEPSQQEDLNWLDNLQSNSGALFAAPFVAASLDQDQPARKDEASEELPHIPPFTPRRTSPLAETDDQSMPDWLKDATEQPSMPVGPQALDQFREEYKIPSTPEEPFTWKSFMQGAALEDEGPAPSQPEPLSADPAVIPPPSDSSPLISQDVESIFSEDLPDWLSHPPPASSQPVEQIGVHEEGGDALSPVDLPLWVQAMRPVEAVISETAPGVEDQPPELAGPLAGLRGAIPAVAIGALRKPQPIPLKLQATDEQQAGAGILEQILLGETTPRPLVSTPVLISQRILRWVIAGLMIFALGAVVFSGTQIMPVSASLPPAASTIPDALMTIPENAPVLAILDYEAALSGEMEASSGPLLDQMIQLRQPHLSFLADSPAGTALIERLLVNTGINQPDGLGYVEGQNYTNMGYLPGGEAGVLAFIQSPSAAIPSSPVLGFSEYAAILLLTDHADSARAWVEQVHAFKESDPASAGQPFLAVSSAQAGPMLQPYVSSGQVDGLINGLAVAARYESLNDNRPGIARSYWDAFGVGMILAVLSIVVGSLWSVFTGIPARRAQAAEE